MMETKVESVARALAERSDIPQGGYGGWEAWLGPARAAIEAMREPTEAMLDAGVDRWDTHHPGATETHQNERATWRAMIDAALSETRE
jgi:hypothetical protein